jgi:hypothetical protein
MRRIQKISELQPTIGFTKFDIYRDYRQSFVTGEPGKIYKLFPFASRTKELGIY